MPKLIILYKFLLILTLSACQTNESFPKVANDFEFYYHGTKVGEKTLHGTQLPIEQIEGHLGTQLHLPKSLTTKEPNADLQIMTEQELILWLSSTQITLGIDSNHKQYEEWIFPEGATVLFEKGHAYYGKFKRSKDNICFEYEDSIGNWCTYVMKSDSGYYFRPINFKSDKYWAYVNATSIDSNISGRQFFENFKSGNAIEDFTVSKSYSTAANNHSTHSSINPLIPSNDIAIIIGNGDYQTNSSNIPDVDPATNDANAIYEYLLNNKGLSPNNIIRLNNATQSQMVNAFGSYRNHKGSAFNWVKPGKSNLYVYYAGHGAPSEDGGLLIPTDAKYDSVELNGYPVSQLLNNLSKIPAKSITVMLESCFSGVSAGGTVVANASPIYIQKPFSSVPENINLITAAGPNQIASWQKDKRQSLFTKYLLAGLKGQADSAEYGNGDGKVDQQELQRFLDDTMTYEARRGYGREQSAKVQFTNGFVF